MAPEAGPSYYTIDLFQNQMSFFRYYATRQ